MTKQCLPAEHGPFLSVPCGVEYAPPRVLQDAETLAKPNYPCINLDYCLAYAGQTQNAPLSDDMYDIQ